MKQVHSDIAKWNKGEYMHTVKNVTYKQTSLTLLTMQFSVGVCFFVQKERRQISCDFFVDI